MSDTTSSWHTISLPEGTKGWLNSVTVAIGDQRTLAVQLDDEAIFSITANADGSYLVRGHAGTVGESFGSFTVAALDHVQFVLPGAAATDAPVSLTVTDGKAVSVEGGDFHILPWLGDGIANFLPPAKDGEMHILPWFGDEGDDGLMHILPWFGEEGPVQVDVDGLAAVSWIVDLPAEQDLSAVSWIVEDDLSAVSWLVDAPAAEGGRLAHWAEADIVALIGVDGLALV